MTSFLQIAQLLGGEVISAGQDTTIDTYFFDSRRALFTSNSLFLAISGKNNDGHHFIGQLYEAGVRNFMVEKRISPLPGANILFVPHVITALQAIAAHHRRQFQYPVLAITGSNGKTILKEWLGQTLSRKFNLVKSPKSYNSQLGTPLSVLRMQPDNTFAVFEAGISKPGEMQRLKEVLQPTLGVFTTLGPAHDEGFESREQKAREKWRLFADAEWVVYCRDHDMVNQSRPQNVKTFTWGKSPEADLRILSSSQTQTGSSITLQHNQATHQFEMPFFDKASVENAMHLIAVLIKLDFDDIFIQESLKELKSVPMRLEVKRGINQTTIIDDTYNNDLAGLQTALEFLNNQSRNTRKVLILSDILQAGNSGAALPELITMINNAGIDQVYGIGPLLTQTGDRIHADKEFFMTTEEFLSRISPDRFFGETILIKGARPFQFEKISNFLSEKIHGTKLEVNLDALSHNLNYYKSLLKPDVKIMVMVKAFAYGSGSVEVAHLLQFHQVDYLAVAYADEGIELRRQGISAPILVMNTTSDGFEKLIKYRLEPEIFSVRQLKSLIQFLNRAKTPCPIHLKIDTGMKRLGFEWEEMDLVMKLVAGHPYIKVQSAFTHLAGADEERHNEFSLQQLALFQKHIDKIKDALNYTPLFHALNSPGIIRFPEYQYDMVRLGVGLYGHESCGMRQEKLRPVGTLKTEISQIKKVKKGDTIGYGRKGRAERDATIATIAIGYADGFSRAFGNGRMTVNVGGRPAPLIGNICMDMSMIDITGIDAQEGDEVVIFGESPTIQDLAAVLGTIPYEVLTSVGERVKRVYFSE